VRFSQETGLPGPTRFFKAPLGKEISWLLPFGLLAIIAAVISAKITLPLRSPVHKHLILWGGWLVTCLVFFSAAGFFHAYYMIMLAPALGAVVGIGVFVLREMERDHPQRGLLLLILITGATLMFQLYLAFQFESWMWWMIIPIVMLLAAGGLFLIPQGSRRLAWILALAAMFIFPLAWSGLTALNRENVNLPAAYSGQVGKINPQHDFLTPRGIQENPIESLVDLFEANSAEMKYLAAVPNARIGSQLVLETGRPVLYMGGFSGNDPVLTVPQLAEMIEEGELRYVVGGTNRQMERWLRDHCSEEIPGNKPTAPGYGRPGGPGQREDIGTVYDCGG
jgi:4-amino-4-deoxy-L-arabinose transferase-like glycosyltransferase